MELTPKKILLHTGLFLLTFVTTTLAGSEWVHAKSISALLVGGTYTWEDFLGGMPYSVPFLLILSVHEFGHYLTAVHYRVKTTLPYYIPLPPILPLMIGTLGALIRLKSRVPTKQQNFDIGVAGPLAGFVAAVGVLWYGFATLPPPEYIFQFHPEYQKFGLDYASYVYGPEHMTPNTIDVVIGKNLMFMFFEKFVADPSRIPNPHEIMHYPYLLAGFLSLVFTSINLFPIGQLDGGHVTYGLFGYRRHKIIATVFYIAFLFFTGLGYVVYSGANKDPWWMSPVYIGLLYIGLTGLRMQPRDTIMYAMIIFTVQFVLVMLVPGIEGYTTYFWFAILIGRLVGIAHPPSEIEDPLTDGRKVIGWLALIVLVVCFTPLPVDASIFQPVAPADGGAVTHLIP
jgi:membrane-associated protease RseP (regulator of RpoE activity)